VPAAKAGLAVAGGTQARTGVHAWRDAEFDFGSAFEFAVAMARFARLFQDASGAFAVRTRLRDAEDAARGEHLPRPPQVEHIRILEPGSMPEPLHASQRSSSIWKFPFAAERRVFQCDFQIITQVVTPPRLRRVLAAAEETFKNTTAPPKTSRKISNGS